MQITTVKKSYTVLLNQEEKGIVLWQTSASIFSHKCIYATEY